MSSMLTMERKPFESAEAAIDREFEVMMGHYLEGFEGLDEERLRALAAKRSELMTRKPTRVSSRSEVDRPAKRFAVR